MRRAFLPFLLCAAFGLTALQWPAAAASDRCKVTFNRSEMSFFSFERLRCTNKGWSIARRQGESQVQCAALNPSGQMIVVMDSNGTSSIMLRNLSEPEWITTADQFAQVEASVDGLPVLAGLMQVDVSKSPPLRYGVMWQLPKDNVELLQSGRVLVVNIEKTVWKISLSGSRVAISAARACASSQGRK